MKKSSVVIIGTGLSALVASAYLAQSGYDVCILEKNSGPGGRARQLKKDGFTFDIGPTFYWMPDVFDRFFVDFNKQVSDYYTLERLNPGYEVYFGKEDSIKLVLLLKKLSQLLSSIKKEVETNLENLSITLEKTMILR